MFTHFHISHIHTWLAHYITLFGITLVCCVLDGVWVGCGLWYGMGLRLLHISTCSHIFTFHIFTRGSHITSHCLGLLLCAVCWMGCGWGVGYGMAWDLDFYTFLHVHTFSHFTYSHVARTLHHIVWDYSCVLCVGWGVGGVWVMVWHGT